MAKGSTCQREGGGWSDEGKEALLRDKEVGGVGCLKQEWNEWLS